MEEVSAQISPTRGSARMAASVLQGLGFQVFRVGPKMSAKAPAGLWEEVFGVQFLKRQDAVEPSTQEVLIPSELAELVEKVEFVKPR